jgi:hypothetical protein
MPIGNVQRKTRRPYMAQRTVVTLFNKDKAKYSHIDPLPDRLWGLPNPLSSEYLGLYPRG